MEDNTSIEVSFRLAPADLSDLWRSSPIRYLSWLLIAIGIYLTYFVLADIVSQGFSAGTALIVICNGIVAMGALLGGFFLARFRAWQMVRYGPTLREFRRYSFSADGVHFDADLMTCDCRWGSFFRIVESRRSFLLYLSPLFAIVIPKAYLSKGDDRAHLRALFRRHFKGKLKLRG